MKSLMVVVIVRNKRRSNRERGDLDFGTKFTVVNHSFTQHINIQTPHNSKPSIRNKSNDESSEEEPIMLIPTLEEEGEEEVDQMPIVAPAPKILTLNIKSIQELDRDIKYSLPTASEGGIDLSALTQILAPQSSVCVSLFPVLIRQ